MNIFQIADRLNAKALNERFQIALLPELRKKYLHKKQLPAAIFTKHTIFNGDYPYAFHHGGRDEMQFNIGEEYIGNRIFTRYALCFSLEKSQSLLNPVGDLEPFRKRFNQCVENHIDYFNGFEMWYYRNGERNGNYSTQIIPKEWFQVGTFISIGKTVEKRLSNLSDRDLTEILIGFDSLLPIYQYCVLQSPSIFSKEKRIAKICWNESDWIKPSGEYGKSKDTNSHERHRGYGHEEWLFDFEKLIEGYHYALLQSIQNGRDSFLSKIFDVKLYSHNSETKENLWIGSIRNLEVISIEDANEIDQRYQEEGWINEMAKDIISVGGDVAHFRQLEPHLRFNVRFKPEYTKLDLPYTKVDDFDQQIGTYHYQFIRDKSSDSEKGPSTVKRRNFKFISGKAHKTLTKRISKRQAKIVQSEAVHDKIQSIFYEYLVGEFGEGCVGMEANTGLSTRIDIAVQSKGKIILYEVKSYPSVMISIRMALGQLFEYAYYPNPITNLQELVIVSHIPLEQNDKEYLEFLRQTTSLNIFYQSVDIENKSVSAKQ